MPSIRFSPRRVTRFALLAALLIGPLASPAAAQSPSWPQFLGPARNGKSAETKLIDAFPASGPKEVWRVAGGVGMSGLAIDRGRLLTMIQTDGQQQVIALEVATGKSVWQMPVAPEYENAMGNGPRATPTISGDRVFVHTGEGVLAALNFADGKILWSHNVPKELGGEPAEYGMSCSPLVVGQQVLVIAGAPQATVVAFDVATGKIAWKAGDAPAGYASLTLLTIAGRSHVVAFAGNALLGLDPKTGGLLWEYPYETNFRCNTASPVAVEGRVLISSGENHGSVLLAIEPAGAKFTVKEIWSSQGTRSVLRAEWQTPILLDGFLYGMDNLGGAGPITHLTCINAQTGERVWQQPRFGKGNFLYADGKLFITTMKGELVLVKATPDGYQELARATILGETRQAPALAGGLLYLRDGAEIVCLDVRK